MYPKKKTPAERGQMIFMIVCLSFLLGTVGGAVAANLAGRSGEEKIEGAFDGRRRFLFLVYLLEIHEV